MKTSRFYPPAGEWTVQESFGGASVCIELIEDGGMPGFEVRSGYQTLFRVTRDEFFFYPEKLVEDLGALRPLAEHVRINSERLIELMTELRLERIYGEYLPEQGARLMIVDALRGGRFINLAAEHLEDAFEDLGFTLARSIQHWDFAGELSAESLEGGARDLAAEIGCPGPVHAVFKRYDLDAQGPAYPNIGRMVHSYALDTALPQSA